MNYAVIQTGGKQYKVSEGDILEIEKIEGEKDKKLALNEVLLVVKDGKIEIGNPLISGASVEVVILDQVRGDKIRVAKFKAKSRYRRVTGHRQYLTKVKIDSINDGKTSKKSEKEESKS